MYHSTLDIIVPTPAPSRCGRKSKDNYVRPRQNQGIIIGRDTTQKGKTSTEQVPVQQMDYDNSSMGASLPFLITMVLYLCFRFVRNYRRKHGLSA